MNLLKILVAAGASAAVAFGSASAVTLSIVGGADTLVPLNFDPDEGVPAPVAPGVTMVKSFTGPASQPDVGLFVDGEAFITFTYLGSEASFGNTSRVNIMGGGIFNDVLFDNQGNEPLSGVELGPSFGPGFIPFSIVSDQGQADPALNQIVGHNALGGSSILFAVQGVFPPGPVPGTGIALTLAFLKVTDTSAIVFFGDNTGDTDLDDLVFRIDVREVPIPGAALLFGTALLGGGFLRRRKRQTA